MTARLRSANSTPSWTRACVPITRSTEPSLTPSRTRWRSLPVTGLDRHHGGVKRDDGLARADVSLEQAVHGPGRAHVLPDLLDGPSLRLGELEGQPRQIGGGMFALGSLDHALLGSLHPSLAVGHTEFERKELVELQPFHRGLPRLVVLGKVDVAQRSVLVDHAFGGH